MIWKVCRFLIASLSFWSTLCAGVVPAGQLNIRYSYTTIDFSVASFGGEFTEVGYSPYYRLLIPASDSKGCGKVILPEIAHSTSKPIILVLERGTCSFYEKAKNAQDAGASAVLIYNSLEGIYGSNSYASSLDYNCDNDQAWVSSAGEPSTCGSSKSCDSGICVSTNATNSEGASQMCCAWDLYLSMGHGKTNSDESTVEIPVGFLRMQDYNTLSSYASFGMNAIDVLVYEKVDWWNWSSFTIWVIAVSTVIYGAIHAAEEDKIHIHTGGRNRGIDNLNSPEDREDASVSSSASLRRVRRKRKTRSSADGMKGEAITESTGLLSPASRNDDEEDGHYQESWRESDNISNSVRVNKSVWWSLGLFGSSYEENSQGGVDGRQGDELFSHSYSADNDDHTLGSLRSGASEFFLRVKGHVVHATEHTMEGLEGGPALALSPLHALLFLLTASAFLILLYFFDIFKYYTLFYLMAAAVCFHSLVLTPCIECIGEYLYKWIYLYDCTNLGDDFTQWWDDCCMDMGCNDQVPYRLPEMTVDNEEAIYDEETGELVTDSALNHNSRYYVRPPQSEQEIDRDHSSGVRNERLGRQSAGDRLVESRQHALEDQLSGSSRRGNATYGTDSDLVAQQRISYAGGSSPSINSYGNDYASVQSSAAGTQYGVSGSIASHVGGTLSKNCHQLCTAQATRGFLILLSLFASASVAAAWYMYPTYSLRWLIQDVLGVSVCVAVLTLVQIPNLKVASLLLVCAFLYDIFFTLISPLLFGSSVMVDVASGASATDELSPLNEDENYCEKYPTEAVCSVSELPMMLYMPAFLTWDTNNDAVLGLGDIILPGLLLVWAARYDLRRYGSLYTERAGNGYFPMIAMGYAIGLCLSMVAMEATDTGQPALMYLVPCTLGPTLIRSLKSDTLTELWEGLPPMKSIGLLLDEQEQEKLRTGRPTDLVTTTAAWPWDRPRSDDGATIDDQSIHSLHGYNLDSARRVGLQYSE